MDSQPKVSVIITCYNYAKYLAEAVDSVLAQDYANIETIVIDDGSTDESGKVAKSYDAKVQYVYQNNAGVSAARNHGIELAKGSYIIFLDADDVLDPNYISMLVSYATKTNADIIYTDVRQFGNETKVSDFPEYNFEILKNRNFIHVSSLIRKEVLNDTRFDTAMAHVSHEDWDFFLQLCVSGAVAVKCSDVALNYRIHGPSRNNRRQTIEERKKYMDAYHYIISKHSDSEGFNYLSGDTFTDWYVHLYNEYKYNLDQLNKYASRGVKLTARELISKIIKKIGIRK